MNETEYKAQKAALHKKHQQELDALDKEFTYSNNPYKIGDTITDHYHTIRITGIKAAFVSYGEPQILFTGVELKKDGTPKLKQKDPDMYLSNIIEPISKA